MVIYLLTYLLTLSISVAELMIGVFVCMAIVCQQYHLNLRRDM